MGPSFHDTTLNDGEYQQNIVQRTFLIPIQDVYWGNGSSKDVWTLNDAKIVSLNIGMA